MSKKNIPAKTQQHFANELLHFINSSPTAYHAVDNAAVLLKANGFHELLETERWELAAGGKYFVTRNHSALVAFELGEAPADNGFRILGTHTDSPCFKIKPGNCMVTGDGYVRLNTEVYGSPILSTWFDRPLAVAGRVICQTEDLQGVCEVLVDLHKPLFVIPNLCIHFQRGDDAGQSGYNKQNDLLPFFCLAQEKVQKGDYVFNLLSDVAEIEKDRILDYELYLYEYEKGVLTGIAEEFISAGRLDDLSMVYAGLQGLLDSEKSNRCKVFAAFDHEEVGSTSVSGANGSYLQTVLHRICQAAGADTEGYYRALANSIAISADLAHAVHPNYVEKHDPDNHPVLGGGPVIKYSAAQRYATNAVTAAYFIKACQEADVPYQKFVNNSNVVGGSTIGPALSGRLSIPTVDMGTPIWAMHSIREFGCVADQVYAARAFEQFFTK